MANPFSHMLLTLLREKLIRDFGYAPDVAAEAIAGYANKPGEEIQLAIQQLGNMPFLRLSQNAHMGGRPSLQDVQMGRQPGVSCSSPSGMSEISLQDVDDDAIIDILKQDYGEQLREARQRVYVNPRRQQKIIIPMDHRGSLDVDIGKYFQLMGRIGSYKALLHGGLCMYRTFMSPSASPSSFLRQPVFFSMVAFPGAGKSTFGLDFSSFLVEQWMLISEERRLKILRSYLDEGQIKEYLQMIEQFHYFNLCCYHCLEVTQEGTWLPDEDDLRAPHILALRCLHAAVTRPNTVTYAEFLKKLRTKRSHVCKQLLLKHVIQFVRKGLDIEEGKQILLCWFFDEVNAAKGSFSYLTLANGNSLRPTWFQVVLSEYVKCLDELRKKCKSTFPMMSIGTTRFSAGNMKFTATGRAKAIMVPLRPLKFREVEAIVLGLMERLALTIGEGIFHNTLSDSLALIVKFCGGMPGLLALLIQALLDESPTRSPRELLASLRKVRTQDEVYVVLMRLLGRIGEREYFVGYLSDSSKVVVLLRALAVSVLGNIVTRQQRVLEGSPFTDTWGDLEAEGLVGLKNCHAKEMDEREEEVEVYEHITAVDVGSIDVQVCFCPLLLIHLANRHLALPNQKSWMFEVPNVDKQWWKKIEGAHIGVLMFRLELLRVSFNRDTFKVQDLFPAYAIIPRNLNAFRFHMPQGTERMGTRKLKSKRDFLKHASEHGTKYAFIGPGNFGMDSWFCAIEVDTRSKVFVCLQSRSTLSDSRSVSCRKIIASCEEDCKKWFTVPKLNAEQQRIREEILTLRYERSMEAPLQGGQGDTMAEEEHTDTEDTDMEPSSEELCEKPPEFIYVYCTDENVSSQTIHQLQELVLHDDPWCKRIILWHSLKDSTTNDPLALLQLLKYVRDHPRSEGPQYDPSFD